MADSQPTDSTDNAVQDAPHTDAPIERRSLLDTLPDRLAADRYVRYLAAEADEARAKLDRERDEHRDLRRDYLETLHKGLHTAVERDTLRAELAGVKAARWDAADTARIIALVTFCILAIGIFAVPAIMQAVS